jgi:hypothetical protein
MQVLIDEVNEVKGVKDSKEKPDDWWKQIDWKKDDMRTVYDSLNDETRKLIADEGLCPDCPEKTETPAAPEETIDEFDLEADTFIKENVGADAVLSYKQKSEHPDEDYAYIDPDCKKVDGKTPQSCRHLLIHDPAHVRAALAALGGARSGKVPPYADKAKPKVCAAAKKFKIESTICGTEKTKKDVVESKLDPYAVLRRADEVLKRQ